MNQNEWQPWQYVLLLLAMFLVLGMSVIFFNGCTTARPQYDAPTGSGYISATEVGRLEQQNKQFEQFYNSVGDTLQQLQSDGTGAAADSGNLEAILTIFVRRVAELQRAYDNLTNSLNRQLEAKP